jgi:hypothetical protein
MITWVRIYPKFNGGETHHPPSVVCPEEIAQQMVDSWEKNKPEGAIIPTMTIGPLEAPMLFDLGGIMWVHRKEYEFEIGDLPIKIPAGHVGGYIYAIDNGLPTEKLGDIEFHPLASGRFWIACLYKEHIVELRKKLEELLPEAEAFATVENKRFNDDLVDDPESRRHVVAKRRPVGKIEEA